VVEVGGNGEVAVLLGEHVHAVLDEAIDAGPVLDDDHRGEGPAQARHAHVEPHRRAVDVDPIPLAHAASPPNAREKTARRRNR